MNIQLTQGNYGMFFNINIQDQDGIPLNLTGSTLSADVVFPDKTKKNYSVLISDYVNGKARFEVTSELTTQVGTHACYIDIVGPLSRVTVSPVIKYSVKADDGGY